MEKEDDKQIISKVRGVIPNQRRVTIPKEDVTLTEGDLVEVKKVVAK